MEAQLEINIIVSPARQQGRELAVNGASARTLVWALFSRSSI